MAVWGHGRDNERWLVDRFALRRTEDGDPLRPAAMIEHWDPVTERVVNGTYRLGDGRELRIHAVAVDSGGHEGVTELAYAWWRGLVRKGLARRVHPVKGDGRSRTAPMVKRTFPDASKRKDRLHGGRGDVPVLLINADKVKDAVYLDLQRDVPGPGYVHFPQWTPPYVFEELAAERRTRKGWERIGRRRNETRDLAVYDRALWRHLGGDGVDWDRPAEPDRNGDVVSKEQRNTLRRGSQPHEPIGPRRRGLVR